MCNHCPIGVAGETDEILPAFPSKTVLQGELEEGGHRVGIAEVDYPAIINMPEPDVERGILAVLEYAVLGYR